MKSRMDCWLPTAAFCLDRASKVWVMRQAADRWPIALWPGVLQLDYVRNTGAAFGLLQGRPALLAWVTGLALLALAIWLLLRGEGLPALPRRALWLMLGGAAGNLFDRAVYGYVVDFIEIRLFRFPVFNVADICVTVSFCLLAGWILLKGDVPRDG